MQTLSFRVGALSNWVPSIPLPRKILMADLGPVQFDGRGEEREGMCGVKGASRRRPATASLASVPQVRVNVVTSTGHVSPITFTRGCMCGCASVHLWVVSVGDHWVPVCRFGPVRARPNRAGPAADGGRRTDHWTP
eukprot:GHVU01014053.1.p1 GENE.GHVU01014053.1~~GHVU01014053.1.p1  ORF type:complete len:136 (-),score=3.97 GHVU01014053.1:557-964(-)